MAARGPVDTLPITTRAASGPQSIGFRDDAHGIALGGGNATQPGDTLAAATSDGGRTWSPRARPPLRTGVWGGVYVPNASRPTIVAVGPARRCRVARRRRKLDADRLARVLVGRLRLAARGLGGGNARPYY